MSHNIQFYGTPVSTVITQADVDPEPPVTPVEFETKPPVTPIELETKSPVTPVELETKPPVTPVELEPRASSAKKPKSPDVPSVPISKLTMPIKTNAKNPHRKHDNLSSKHKKVKMHVNGQSSEAPDAPVSYMEEKRGIPSDMTDPIECSVIESTMIEKTAENRNKSKDAALRHYLCNGYVVYIKWLQSKMRSVKLSEKDQAMAVFCVARDINKYDPSKRPMGIDIDIFAIMYEHWMHSEADCSLGGLVAKVLESFEGAVVNGKRLDKAQMEELAIIFVKRPDISMSLDAFKKRLQKVPTTVLDEHSSNVWRGTVGLINCHMKGSEKLENLVIDLSSIRKGHPMAPLPGFHLGIRMLEIEGIIAPTAPSTPYTPTRKVVVRTG